jgi:Ca2+/Na+ antiporter
MSWNWEVFLKSWLFGFLGFLLGVVSTVIYLALDVDLSQLDGLQILTAVLIAITIWYAYSTHRMLEEQRKTRKIEYLRYRLEKLYYPLLNYLNETSNLNTIDILPFVYLGSNKFIELFNVYFKAEVDPNITTLEFQDAISDLMKVVDNDINNFKYELDELIR